MAKVEYKGLMQAQVSGGIDGIAPRKSSLSIKLSDQYRQRLFSFMEKEKPFLDSALTIDQLAEMVSIPTRSLSEVINNSLGQNFYDFVNSHRIDEAQSLLADRSADEKTVLEVLYAVGFNSKSSFHNAFKKRTGMTPSQYRKQHAA